MTAIDLNADLGEGGSSDAQLLTIVSSCNIACGGHAGDAESIETTITAALANRVVVGAHPSYADKAGFGRQSNFMCGDALRQSLHEQLREIRQVADRVGAIIMHVKPHGALYNDAADDLDLANEVVDVIASVLPQAAVVGLPNSELAAAAQQRGLRFVAEGFIDRAYQANGRLSPRDEPNAVHNSIEQMSEQAISLLGRVETLCIHGDTPGAVAAATAIRNALQDHGVSIRAITG